MTFEEKTIEAAERYLSRQPVHKRDHDGQPLWTQDQMVRAFCAGQVAVIERDPAPRQLSAQGINWEEHN